jgi:UDP-glucose 4-epimerase
LICKEYVEKFGMNVSALRYFNVYGNRQHKDGQYAPAIGKFLSQKQSGIPLTVVGDGKQKRDFINVKDVVEANYLAFKKNKEFNIYNIGSGYNISVIDLAKTISDKIEFIAPREGECRETLSDISKANNVLGWKPKIMLKEYLDERI